MPQSAEEIAECKRKWAAEHKEEIAAKKKLYYENHKEEILRKHQQYYSNHKEEIKEKVKTWKQDNKEHVVAYRKTHYEENKEEILGKQKEYLRENRDKRSAYISEWAAKNPKYKAEYRKNNPELAAEWDRKKRATKRVAPHEPYTTDTILQTHGSHCHLCKSPIDLEAPRHPSLGSNWQLSLHLDHVVPLSRGGTDLISNVKPAHAICNLRKHDKLLEEMN